MIDRFLECQLISGRSQIFRCCWSGWNMQIIPSGCPGWHVMSAVSRGLRSLKCISSSRKHLLFNCHPLLKSFDCSSSHFYLLPDGKKYCETLQYVWQNCVLVIGWNSSLRYHALNCDLIVSYSSKSCDCFQKVPLRFLLLQLSYLCCFLFACFFVIQIRARYLTVVLCWIQC